MTLFDSDFRVTYNGICVTYAQAAHRQARNTRHDPKATRLAKFAADLEYWKALQEAVA